MSQKNRAGRQKTKQPFKSETSGKSLLARHAALLSVIVVLLFLIIVRLRLADVPLERDEGEYAYEGQLILRGIPPYQLAYNMKLPGTYYAFAVIMALFGQTSWVIHIGLLIVNSASTLILFFLARRVLSNNTAGAVAAIAFAFLSIDRWIMGVFGHATQFVVFAAIAGFLVLVH